MKKLILFIVNSLPVIVSAQSYNVSNINGAIVAITDIVNAVFPLLVGIGVFILAWGIFVFIVNAGDPEERKKGSARILWGVIGVFLMLSVWGLINILVNTFYLNNNVPAIPQVSVPSSS